MSQNVFLDNLHNSLKAFDDGNAEQKFSRISQFKTITDL